MNPIDLLWWAIQPAPMLAIVGLLALAIIMAIAVFGGGWS